MPDDAALQNLQSLVAADMERFEERLNDALSGARGVIDDVTGHLSHAGGKRMRPIVTLLCGQLGAGQQPASDAVLTACLVVELTHLATLYHDDVMDSAPTRRGVDSVHMVYGNNRAILAGDVIFARASANCALLGARATGQHAETFTRLCHGQLNESFGPEQGDDPVDFYISVLADKTGSLVAQAARFGAEHSGASLAIADMVAEFGEDIGVAFQIADDVLDIASDAEISGKTPGTDLAEGVDTLPVLLLRRHAAAGTIDSDGERILELLDGRRGRAELQDFDQSQDAAIIDDVVTMLRDHPVLDETRALARVWADKAKNSLAELEECAAKTALYQFADLLVDRLA